MGRSCGGHTSKIHALVDADGRPVKLLLTAGQVADCTEADTLIEDLGEGDILLADKGYDSNAIRAKASERKAWANIPPKTNRTGTFVFSPWVLPAEKSGGAVLQQNKTLPRNRDPLRQTTGKLPGRR